MRKIIIPKVGEKIELRRKVRPLKNNDGIYLIAQVGNRIALINLSNGQALSHMDFDDKNNLTSVGNVIFDDVASMLIFVSRYFDIYWAEDKNDSECWKELYNENSK